PEVVGTSGILVPPHPEPVASAMTHIASSSDVAKHVGQSGLDRSKRFSWRETARQTAIVYQAVL
ncbi:MAG: glycosyltransferase, partial [Thermomicrobiales bacterium]